jgi:hypothetical protein
VSAYIVDKATNARSRMGRVGRHAPERPESGANRMIHVVVIRSRDPAHVADEAIAQLTVASSRVARLFKEADRALVSTALAAEVHLISTVMSGEAVRDLIGDDLPLVALLVARLEGSWASVNMTDTSKWMKGRLLMKLVTRVAELEEEIESWRSGKGPCCEEMADTGGHHGDCIGWPR